MSWLEETRRVSSKKPFGCWTVTARLGGDPRCGTVMRRSESWRFWSAAMSTHVGQSLSVLYAEASVRGPTCRFGFLFWTCVYIRPLPAYLRCRRRLGGPLHQPG